DCVSVTCWSLLLCGVMLTCCASVSASSQIYTLSLHDALPILSMSRSTKDVPHRVGFLKCTRTRPSGSASMASWANGGRSRYLQTDRKSTRLNSSHVKISYAVFCLKKKKTNERLGKSNLSPICI